MTSSLPEAIVAAAGDRTVLSVDPALVDAVNARSGYSGRGKKAYTPRQLLFAAHPDDAILGRRDQAVLVREELGVDIRDADRLVEEINSCWSHDGTIDAIREYDGYDTDRVRQAIDVLDDRLTMHRAIEQHGAQEDVLVVDPGEFDAIESRLIPDDAERYRTAPDLEAPETAVFQDSAALLDQLRDVLDRLDPGTVAISVAGETDYAAAIESMLEVEDIPYLHGRSLDELPATQDLVAVLELLAYGAASVEDARAACRALGIDHDPRMAEARPTEAIEAAIGQHQDHSIGELASMVGCHEDVLDHIERLGLTDDRPRPEAVEELRYYLDRFAIEADSTDHGVLIADATAAGHIDRPVVLHVGADADWDVQAPDHPWIDLERFQQRQLARFRRLLASGQRRLLLTQRSRSGEDVAPCVYLAHCCGIAAFDGPLHRGQVDGGDGFERQPLESEHEPLEQFSQSSLNAFLRCPKDYELSRLTDARFKVHFRQGTAVHEFAECYVNAPETVRDRLVEIEDWLFDRIEPYLDPHQEEQKRYQLQQWMEILMEYLDSLELQDIDIQGYTPEDDNELADALGIDVTGDRTEQEFRTDTAHGFIDLLAAPDLLIDHKTSKSATGPKEHVLSVIDPEVEEPDVQAGMYLAQHRHRLPDDRPLTFRFFYVQEYYRQRLQDGDPEDAVVEVRYRPETLAEYLRTEDCFETACAFSSKSRTPKLEEAGQQAFQAALEEIAITDEEWRDHTVMAERKEEAAAVFQDHGIDLDPNGARITLKHLIRHRQELLFRDDLDRFEERVGEQLERMNDYRRDGFPRPTDVEELRLDRRDMLLTGDTG